jgi:hypothetical protein
MAEARNMLAEASSPYLQQHKDNPVHWRIWGPHSPLHRLRRLPLVPCHGA